MEGETIPGDGDVIEGIGFVNESAITGESAPVLKEPGTDIRSSVTGGTTLTSDQLTIQISADPGETFLDRMIALVEGAKRQRTPNEIALSILLAGLTIVFFLAVVTLRPFGDYAGATVDTVALVALLVCLIPTTIGGLLSAIGIAGMDRVARFNVLAMSGRAVEASGDVDVILLDKTGTITYGNRLAASITAAPGVTEAEALTAALVASAHDETPEGKSVVDLARRGWRSSRRPVAPTTRQASRRSTATISEDIPFRAETRSSGVRLASGQLVLKGAVDAIEHDLDAALPPIIRDETDRLADAGATPLAMRQDGRIIGLIELKDTVKEGLVERFAEFRRMGIRTVMVTGDNPRTAATIAREAGVDDFIAQAKPEDKIGFIRKEQADGHLVAMTGDGTNDAPALAQADVGLAMNSGTSAAKEAANMVDLDSDPTKLLEVIAIGKQLLITRGSITTFSIANDVAKYFAIVPAMFASGLPGAEPAQHHGPVDAPERDPVGGHLQRPGHRRPDPARPARRRLPAGSGERAAPAQPAHLRPRRDHRPVHRDQGDRPPRDRPPPGIGSRSDAYLRHPAAPAGGPAPRPAHPHHRGRLSRASSPRSARSPFRPRPTARSSPSTARGRARA